MLPYLLVIIAELISPSNRRNSSCDNGIHFHWTWKHELMMFGILVVTFIVVVGGITFIFAFT